MDTCLFGGGYSSQNIGMTLQPSHASPEKMHENKETTHCANRTGVAMWVSSCWSRASLATRVPGGRCFASSLQQAALGSVLCSVWVEVTEPPGAQFCLPIRLLTVVLMMDSPERLYLKWLAMGTALPRGPCNLTPDKRHFGKLSLPPLDNNLCLPFLELWPWSQCIIMKIK